MNWNDITEHDLVEGSKGVEEEEHDSPRCQPLVENGIYRKGFRAISKVIACFRNCNCGKYSREDCDKVLQQFRTSGIVVPTDGVDIHGDSRCQYFGDPRKKDIWKDQKKETVYIYPLHCKCIKRAKTAMVYR